MKKRFRAALFILFGVAIIAAIAALLLSRRDPFPNLITRSRPVRGLQSRFNGELLTWVSDHELLIRTMTTTPAHFKLAMFDTNTGVQSDLDKINSFIEHGSAEIHHRPMGFSRSPNGKWLAWTTNGSMNALTWGQLIAVNMDGTQCRVIAPQTDHSMYGGWRIKGWVGPETLLVECYDGRSRRRGQVDLVNGKVVFTGNWEADGYELPTVGFARLQSGAMKMEIGWRDAATSKGLADLAPMARNAANSSGVLLSGAPIPPDAMFTIAACDKAAGVVLCAYRDRQISRLDAILARFVRRYHPPQHPAIRLVEINLNTGKTIGIGQVPDDSPSARNTVLMWLVPLQGLEVLPGGKRAAFAYKGHLYVTNLPTVAQRTAN